MLHNDHLQTGATFSDPTAKEAPHRLISMRGFRIEWHIANDRKTQRIDSIAATRAAVACNCT
jgi:hypothetical protein